MNDELRERLARVCHSFVRHTDVQELEDWPTYVPLADAISAEIEAAGYVLLERGRAERLIGGTRLGNDWYKNGVLSRSGRFVLPKRSPDIFDALQPGDLDPLEGGE